MEREVQTGLTNFGLQKAMAHMTVDIGMRLTLGQDVSSLQRDIFDAVQINRLFLAEFGYEFPDYDLLDNCNFLINTLVHDYLLSGEHIVDETILLPLQTRSMILQVTGEGDSGGGPAAPSIYNIRILPADFQAGWIYQNGWLDTVVYSLDIRGGATLVLNKDYVLIPGGGFQLINDITLDPLDYIMLNVISSFSTPPGGPGPGTSFPYPIPYLIPQ